MEGSSSSNSVTQSGNIRPATSKREVYNEVVRRLKDSPKNIEANLPGFEEDLWAHFKRLPTRYAMDVNVERAEDVLMHKKMLDLAQDPANQPTVEIRLVQLNNVHDGYLTEPESPGEIRSLSVHPLPAFGSSQNLEAIGMEADDDEDRDVDNSMHAESTLSRRPMHEITFSSIDKPKLLSQLTAILSNIGLNIREAHAFSTTDGYSLDVFVVDGWPNEETEQLKTAFEREAFRIEKASDRDNHLISPTDCVEKQTENTACDRVPIPFDENDVWEINPKSLNFEHKVASGAYGDLYKGTYFNQNVAIKVLKSERLNSDLQREFAQEVYIMRKVRHKNVVQFIGACTKPPSLYIVTEFMSGGSVYDYLHKHRGSFKLPALLKVAIDVSKGMNYLHESNIIHRDLKAANLLMDENDVVKVADFGVARVKAQSGVMTAETGTYRWMAPEVIEHKPYDHKADVFSFGVVLWELITGKLPYEFLTPLQAAVGVVQKDLRPTIPNNVHPKLSELLVRCWQKEPPLRPDFSEITIILQSLAKEVGEEEGRKDISGRLLSAFRRKESQK